MRAEDWWEYKLAPILSTFYATALVLHVTVSSLWVDALMLFLSMVTAAIYASAINELTDREDDAAAGKRNRAADRPRSVATLLIVTTVAGVTFAWLWRDHIALLSCYLAIWLAFALYSIPPFRLKKRGLSGVLCDAAGEQMFPCLTAVFVAYRGGHSAMSGVWVSGIAVWSIAFGLRGILWHQLRDVKNDRAAGVRTFASRHQQAAGVIGAFVVFPLELSAFAFILWHIGGASPAVFLTLYSLWVIRTTRRRHMSPVIVSPKPRSFILLQDFYTDLFPIALLIGASIRDRRDLLILVVHLLVFPRRAFHLARRFASTVRSSINNRRDNASTASTVVNASEPHHGGVG